MEKTEKKFIEEELKFLRKIETLGNDSFQNFVTSHLIRIQRRIRFYENRLRQLK